MWNADFRPGDIISFCGEEFVVLENYGSSGKVRENCPGGVITGQWYWEFQGEKCKLVKRAEDKEAHNGRTEQD